MEYLRTRHAARPRCCSPHNSVAPSPSSTAADHWSKPARPPTAWPISEDASSGTTSVLSISHDGPTPRSAEREVTHEREPTFRCRRTHRKLGKKIICRSLEPMTLNLRATLLEGAM